MIRAGTVEEINWEFGDWIFLDIGFSNKSKSCGILFGDQVPYEAKYNKAVSDICHFLENQEKPSNLVIEAPLSVSFDKDGNPKGRKPEKQEGKTRYWYVGLGCSVMVAATYLLKKISEKAPEKEVRLYEGFVSFKKRNVASNHLEDVLSLRSSVKNPAKGSIIKPEDFKMDVTDKILSAFKVTGMDYGIPPIIQNHG
jgi:hypothetical protein